MGFYSTNTPEQKRVEKLTGDINIHDIFKNECKARGIPIYNAYNIQKKLIFEVESEQLVGVEAVDKRLMELLEERGKNEVPHVYTDLIAKDDKKTNFIPPRPQQNETPEKPKSLSEIKIPPRARDGKTFDLSDDGKIIQSDKTSGENDETVVELLKKLVTQNQKIINQNKIIINELKRIGEKND